MASAQRHGGGQHPAQRRTAADGGGGCALPEAPPAAEPAPPGDGGCSPSARQRAGAARHQEDLLLQEEGRVARPHGVRWSRPQAARDPDAEAGEGHCVIMQLGRQLPHQFFVKKEIQSKLLWWISFYLILNDNPLYLILNR